MWTQCLRACGVWIRVHVASIQHFFSHGEVWGNARDEPTEPRLLRGRFLGGFGRFSVSRFCRFPYENRRVESCCQWVRVVFYPRHGRPALHPISTTTSFRHSLVVNPAPDRLSVDLAACCSLGEGGGWDIEISPLVALWAREGMGHSDLAACCSLGEGGDGTFRSRRLLLSGRGRGMGH